jgi:putative colanic acid biosysnthesis UDP-glucose lipid carrier transferase
MFKRYEHNPVFRVILLDLVLLNLISFIFVRVVKKYNFIGDARSEQYLMLLTVFNLLWIIVNVVITRYKMDFHMGYLEELKKILMNITAFLGLVSIFAFLFNSFRYSRLIIYGSIMTFSLLLFGVHTMCLYFLKVIKARERTGKRILIVGDNHCAVDLFNKLSGEYNGGDEIIIYIENEALENELNGKLILGKLKDAKKIFHKMQIDELYIVLSVSDENEIKELIRVADFFGTRVRMVPSFYKLFERNFEMIFFQGIPVVNANEIPLDKYYNWLYKRVFDVVFSVLSILVTFPLMILIGILIKLTSKGPVLYAPQRVGIEGKLFKMYKFRTMKWTRENNEKLSTTKNDPRITPVGRFLRKSNLDELPQFFNVLNGDMSVVGPRPHRLHLDKKFQNEVDKYMIRHYIKPGITGWAQVNGWRGPTENKEQKKQRTLHDLWYLENWTFLLDLKIILLTIFGKRARTNAF